MIKDIIREEVNKYVRSKCMIKEYKNPNDSETVRVCADMMENLYNSIIENGMSKREITVVDIGKVVKELRHIQKMMS